MLADRLGLPTLSVVNSVGSLIARTTKLGVYLNAGRESSVASTKAFTTQVTGGEREVLPMLLVTCLYVYTTHMQQGYIDYTKTHDIYILYTHMIFLYII